MAGGKRMDELSFITQIKKAMVHQQLARNWLNVTKLNWKMDAFLKKLWSKVEKFRSKSYSNKKIIIKSNGL